jgi:hypothetical protein
LQIVYDSGNLALKARIDAVAVWVNKDSRWGRAARTEFSALPVSFRYVYQK